jgi:hypothetical protein
MLELDRYNQNIAAQEILNKTIQFVEHRSPSLKAQIIQRVDPPSRLNFFDTYA